MQMAKSARPVFGVGMGGDYIGNRALAFLLMNIDSTDCLLTIARMFYKINRTKFLK